MAEDRDGSSGSGQVKGERKDATNSSDGARDFSAVNGASVPGVGGGMGDTFKHEFGRDTTIGRGDGDGFVEDLKEAFDSQSFVVATGDAVMTNFEDLGHGNEITFELAVVVNDNQAAEANFQKDLLHE